MATLTNLGKGTKGTGVNNKIALCIAHKDLKIAKSITFWAKAEFGPINSEHIITDELAIKLLLNLEKRTNENGDFMVWNGKLD
jgi:hypothetical protein